jgi:hypothetical protein
MLTAAKVKDLTNKTNSCSHFLKNQFLCLYFLIFPPYPNYILQHEKH